ncbi:hypothetical protein, partial [Chromobacterium amazonense]|uniref:hypothetical protein n=1 Tax=Chromobacterium amazonense TaxID=1382803 RepID=UPI0031F71D2B
MRTGIGHREAGDVEDAHVHRRDRDARPDKIKLGLDKTGYKAGDTLEVTVTPPHAGKGILMVE